MTSALYLLTTEQMHLLRAALCPADEALAHWQAWRRLRNLHGALLNDEQIRRTLTLLDPTQQRLLPLISRKLALSGDALLPYLQTADQAALGEYQHWLVASHSVLQTLQRAGISALVLNGLPLTTAAGGSSALRPMSELDILVPKAQVDAALEALRCEQLIPSAFGFRHRWWLSSVLLTRADGMQVRIQGHTFPQHAYMGADELFWQKAQSLDLWGGVSALTLSPTHRLFYTLVRGYQNGRKTAFASLPDSIQLIRTERINWNELLDLAEHFTFRLPVQRSLNALQKHTDLLVPPPAAQRLQQMIPTVAEQRYFDLINVVATDAPSKRFLNLRIGQLAFRLFRRHPSRPSLGGYLWSYLASSLIWPEGELSI